MLKWTPITSFPTNFIFSANKGIVKGLNPPPIIIIRPVPRMLISVSKCLNGKNKSNTIPHPRVIIVSIGILTCPYTYILVSRFQYQITSKKATLTQPRYRCFFLSLSSFSQVVISLEKKSAHFPFVEGKPSFSLLLGCCKIAGGKKSMEANYPWNGFNTSLMNYNILHD